MCRQVQQLQRINSVCFKELLTAQALFLCQIAMQQLECGSLSGALYACLS